MPENSPKTGATLGLAGEPLESLGAAVCLNFARRYTKAAIAGINGPRIYQKRL